MTRRRAAHPDAPSLRAQAEIEDARADLVAALSRLQFLTPTQASVIAGVSPAHVRKACASGALPAVTIGRRLWRVTPEAVQAWGRAAAPTARRLERVS